MEKKDKNYLLLILISLVILIGLKHYNNYAISSSSSNNEYVDPKGIYLTSADIIENRNNEFEPDDDDEDYKEIKPFLEISFYKDGTYKEIKRPYNLSEENYKEMKDLLDLIIPKIGNESIFVRKIDQETIEKVREDIQITNSLKYDNTLRNFQL